MTIWISFSDTLNPQKARILLMLALTKTIDTKEIQRMLYMSCSESDLTDTVRSD